MPCYITTLPYFRFYYCLVHRLTYSVVHINTFITSFNFSSLPAQFFHTLQICYSHPRCIIPIPIPIPIMSHMAIPILMGFQTPMHTYIVPASHLEVLWRRILLGNQDDRDVHAAAANERCCRDNWASLLCCNRNRRHVAISMIICKQYDDNSRRRTFSCNPVVTGLAKKLNHQLCYRRDLCKISTKGTIDPEGARLLTYSAFQQDSALSLTANKTQAYLRREYVRFIAFLNIWPWTDRT